MVKRHHIAAILLLTCNNKAINENYTCCVYSIYIRCKYFDFFILLSCLTHDRRCFEVSPIQGVLDYHIFAIPRLKKSFNSSIIRNSLKGHSMAPLTLAGFLMTKGWRGPITSMLGRGWKLIQFDTSDT